MATNILMPALSPTMTEGTLARWLKKEGEAIRAGDVIAEIETDKATMEVEAVDEGVLGKILVGDGTEGVKVNQPIAVLVAQGEAVPAAGGGAAGQGAASRADAPQAGAPQAGASQAGGSGAAGSGAQAGGSASSPAAAGAQAAGSAGQAAAAQSVAATAQHGASEAPAQVAPNRPGTPPGPSASAVVAAPAQPGNGHDADGERIFVSPLARRMAMQAGIDLRGLKGSGPNGRIVKADIEAAQSGRVPAAAPLPAAPLPAAPLPATAPVAGPGARPEAASAQAATPAVPPSRAAAPAITAPHKLVPHSSMRKVIARRLTEAKQTIPHFYVSMDIEIDALMELMGKLNAKSPAERDAPGWYFITINDLVIKAAAATLRRVPAVNAAWTDDGIAVFQDVDISVAVAIPDGLITPIVRKADQKGLLTISREMKDLAARAKAGKLKPEEFQGGGFSISNMGMFGVSQFAAIINPPQAAIMAVAAGQKRPVVKNDALAIATVMTCTLAVDHRVVDGALGAQWLREFKRIVEDPLSLML